MTPDEREHFIQATIIMLLVLFVALLAFWCCEQSAKGTEIPDVLRAIRQVECDSSPGAAPGARPEGSGAILEQGQGHNERELKWH